MTATHKPTAERRSMPERVCSVCLQGVYVTKKETDDQSGEAWHVEACTRCGHVQVFRRDWRDQQH
jgi:hypothetical protein